MARARKGELDFGALVEQIVNDPKLEQVVNKRAEEYLSDVKATWPTSDKTVPDTANFSHEQSGEVFNITLTESEDGRPVAIFEARHPYAAAHQARTGAFTKAAGKTFNEEW